MGKPDGVVERLRDRGHSVAHEALGSGIVSRFFEHNPTLVVLSLPLPDVGPGELMRALLRSSPDLKVILTGPADLVDTGNAMLDGAFDCVLDPLARPDQLLAAVGLALGTRAEDRELGYLRDRQTAGFRLDELVGEDPSMQKVFQFVRQVCRRTAGGQAPAILVMGETGTGKGALARSIHHASARRNHPFVEINCAALPANLVESELFGHEAGAFTGARTARPGLFETADGGTLFLDELASLPLDLQAKILIAIEEKRLRRVGGHEVRTVDVQLVAASQPVLKQMVKTGEFREDLYHRLNVLGVTLPPLRDRGDDVLLLAAQFLARMCREYGLPEKKLAPEAVRFIRRYYWPGNVRELRNQIERIVLLTEGDVIQAFDFERASGAHTRVRPAVDSGFRLTLPPDGLSLVELEREVIRQALELHEGNVSATARYLDISRQTLIYRMRKHKLAAG
ncbi:MAG: sigma 54-interacting transcriptional regulator [Sandaracinaceae bacterium]